MKTRILAVLMAVSVAACAQQPPPPPATAAPPAHPVAPVAAAAPSPAPSEAQIAPGRWNVERVRCSDLLEASDDDRASAAMFYYGYLAAKAGIHVIDVSRIDGNIAKVMRQCEATPNLTVPQAFRQALRPTGSRG
jgi:HdeA/HdeB family